MDMFNLSEAMFGWKELGYEVGMEMSDFHYGWLADMVLYSFLFQKEMRLF